MCVGLEQGACHKGEQVLEGTVLAGGGLPSKGGEQGTGVASRPGKVQGQEISQVHLQHLRRLAGSVKRHTCCWVFSARLHVLVQQVTHVSLRK